MCPILVRRYVHDFIWNDHFTRSFQELWLLPKKTKYSFYFSLYIYLLFIVTLWLTFGSYHDFLSDKIEYFHLPSLSSHNNFLLIFISSSPYFVSPLTLFLIQWFLVHCFCIKVFPLSLYNYAEIFFVGKEALSSILKGKGWMVR